MPRRQRAQRRPEHFRDHRHPHDPPQHAECRRPLGAVAARGLADASRRTPDQPLYTLRNKTPGATVQTIDPGRALISGHWQDIGRFKGPTF
ncbi:MAG TPA: hypothetical protein VGH48_08260 [Caldimonas sp.]